jgi:CRISPR system Cascade subunit CasA
VLTRTALRLFDGHFVGSGAVERQNPRRAALAHRQLRSSLYGPKLRLALGLPVDAAAAKAG